jgi:hypothetical protein
MLGGINFLVVLNLGCVKLFKKVAMVPSAAAVAGRVEQSGRE